MKSKLARACVGSAAAVLGSSPALASEPLHRLGLSSSGQIVRPHAISADGRVVVGWASGITFGAAFRWTGATGLVGLGEIGDPSGGDGSWRATAVSADGLVVVGYGSVLFGTEAFRWTQPTGMVGLGHFDPNVPESHAWGVSGDGTKVVGHSWLPATSDEAFLWTAEAGLVPLGLPDGWFGSSATAISADGMTVAGNGFHPTLNQQPFYWTAATGMVPFGEAGWSYVEPTAVSADGSVIVGFGSSTSGTEAFRWTQATGIVGLGYLPGDDPVSRAYALTPDGSIIVGSAESGSAPYGEAFIWDAVNGMRSLLDVLVTDYGYTVDDWELYEARGISASGRQIVGSGWSYVQEADGWIVHLPVPGVPCTGDTNCDGLVSFGDINPFVLSLVGGHGEYRDQYPDCSWYTADIDQDGDVDFGDINPFVDLLVSSSLPIICP